MYLLDTNVVSELRRPDRANPKVLAWAASTDPNALYISAISVLEIEIGVLRATRRDAAQGALLRRWMDQKVLPTFAGRILAVDESVALRCAALNVPDPRPDRDALIAATALVHRMTIVTRNIADFQPMGAPLIDPWN
jgi:predicted nucleic acid-binding protein